jgi:ABC-type multidrug transport system ATPase subunit
VITVQGLTKRYGKQLANDNLTLTVKAGEIGVLLGPNGAGKSTLIKSICGLLRFQGSVSIDGHDNRSVEAKRLLGYVPEIPTPYSMLTVGEHLEFIAKAYRLSGWRERADELLGCFDMDDKRNKLGKELSKGMQQKVSVCCALLPDPKAVVLDEPLVGLDPHGIRELKGIMARLRQEGKAVLVSTHMIESMEENWDVTFIMKKGRIAREIRRDRQMGERLEDIYFSIVESENNNKGVNEAGPENESRPENETGARP